MANFSTAADDAGMKRMFEKLIDKESRPDKVGPRITALRESLALSKAQFADSVMLDRSSLTKIEAGQAGLDIATGVNIAAIYGVGLDYIYRGDLSDVPLNMRPSLMVQLVTAQAMK